MEILDEGILVFNKFFESLLMEMQKVGLRPLEVWDKETPFLLFFLP